MFSIVQRNPQYVVVNKHPGIAVQDERQGPGLLSKMKQQLAIDSLYPTHRLDKETSGLIVLATTPEANRQISMQFEQRQVEKYYCAISAKKASKKQGWIKGDMVKSRRGAWKLLRSKNNPAITEFKSFAFMPGLRGYLVKPHTGKTHQIRVALKSIGAPILGDPLYTTGEQSCDSDRMYLHSCGLGFYFDGVEQRYVSLPDQGQHFKTCAFLQTLLRYLSEDETRFG